MLDTKSVALPPVIICFSSLPIFTQKDENEKIHLGEPLLRKRRSFFRPPLGLDRSLPEALHRQIYERVKQAIREDHIRRDSLLLSTRDAAGEKWSEVLKSTSVS